MDKYKEKCFELMKPKLNPSKGKVIIFSSIGNNTNFKDIYINTLLGKNNIKPT